MPRAHRDFWEHYRISFNPESGKRFGLAREQMGLNQAQLGALLGVSHDHIRRIEIGETQISHFNAVAFRAVFRDRVNFILFAENREMFGYRTPEELQEIGKLHIRMMCG